MDQGGLNMLKEYGLDLKTFQCQLKKQKMEKLLGEGNRIG